MKDSPLPERAANPPLPSPLPSPLPLPSPSPSPSPHFTLRPETPSDDAFSMGLFASTRAAEMACLAGAAQEVFLRIQHQAQKRAHDAQHPAAERSIVVVSGEPAGRLIVDRSGPDIRLVDVALLPEHRGRGTGTALLRSLLDEAGRTGRKVLLHVLRGSPAARLYERLGFARTDGTEMYDAMEWRPPARDLAVVSNPDGRSMYEISG